MVFWDVEIMQPGACRKLARLESGGEWPALVKMDQLMFCFLSKGPCISVKIEKSEKVCLKIFPRLGSDWSRWSSTPKMERGYAAP